MKPATKLRLVRAYEGRLQNPVVIRLLRFGLRLPTIALVETVGRRTGTVRYTPVMNGLVGDEFWIVAEHGHQAQYVKNIKANPDVSIRIGRRRLRGMAHILPDDDSWARARWLSRQMRRPNTMDVRLLRFFGTEPLTVRVDLHM